MDSSKYILIFLIGLFSVVTAAAQDAIPGKEKKEIIEEISKDYKNWHRAAWSGKLSTDMLPVSATLKVFMEKDKLTMISVRAPFVGEVARIEADKDSILVVNKMKKRYYTHPLAELSQMVPDLTEDLQSLLLGRMFVVGSGQLDKHDTDKVTVFPTDSENCYMLLPDVPDYLPQVLYGFAGDAEGRMSTFVCAYGRADAPGCDDTIDPDFQYEPKAQVQAEISYRNKGSIADLQCLFSGRPYNATLTVDEIEWGAKGFDRINVSGYTKVGFKEVLKFH